MAAASSTYKTSRPCEVSAPGKVLIVGGYLVLQRAFPGLVLAASSRFYSGAWWQIPEDSQGNFRGQAAELLAQDFSDMHTLKPSTTEMSFLNITVISPQFHSTMQFEVQCCPPFCVTPVAGTSPNDFIQRSIACSLLAAYGSLPPHKLSAILQCACTAGARLHLSLQADNDFYSQLPHLEHSGTRPSLPALQALPKCLPMLQDAKGKLQLSKTGMGSSAALTSSLTGALLQILGVTALPQDPGAMRCGMVLQAAPTRAYLPPTSVVSPGTVACGSVLGAANSVRLCHQVAQVAHCLAQGKVGSGFDVASACFGSVAYQRVGSAALGGVMGGVAAVLDASATPTPAAALQAARSMTSMAAWDYALAPFALPPAVDLCLADVCGGSETPSMVRKVLAWLEGTAGASTHWELLGAANAAAGSAMRTLTAMHAADAAGYMDAVDTLCAQPAAAWGGVEGGPHGDAPLWAENLTKAAGNVLQDGSEAHAALQAVLQAAAAAAGDTSAVALQFVVLFRLMRLCRVLLRDMGVAADVPIEPASQSKLLDSTMHIPGVLATGVPGAGGFDAVFALTLQGRQYDGKSEVAQTWLGSARESAGEQLVCPLLLRAEGCAEQSVAFVQGLLKQTGTGQENSSIQ